MVDRFQAKWVSKAGCRLATQIHFISYAHAVQALGALPQVRLSPPSALGHKHRLQQQTWQTFSDSQMLAVSQQALCPSQVFKAFPEKFRSRSFDDAAMLKAQWTASVQSHKGNRSMFAGLGQQLYVGSYCSFAKILQFPSDKSITRSNVDISEAPD